MTLRRFVLGPDVERERIDKVLARLCPDTSRASLQRWMLEGRVLVDGSRCRARDRVRAGSVVQVDPGEAPPSQALPDPEVQFATVYEDDDLLVVDKPAGLVVHPARGHWKGTLVNGLLARESFRRPSADPRDPIGALRPGIVHRIDKGTSGLLVIAKNDRTREGLKLQLQRHTVQRRYLAVTAGNPEPGTIRSLYARDPRSRLRFTTRVREGRSAITHLEVREVFGAGRSALVECRLETGRTHQIRVHLAERAGTPLLADPLYGKAPNDAALDAIARRLARPALHASVLGFIHPTTGESRAFEAPIPEDLLEALAALRAL